MRTLTFGDGITAELYCFGLAFPTHSLLRVCSFPRQNRIAGGYVGRAVYSCGAG